MSRIALTLVAALALGASGCVASDLDCEAQVLVAFHSRDGHTRQMAEAVGRGAASRRGVRVVVRPVAEVDEALLLASHGIVVGSPVYNGNLTPETQAFINGWPFEGAPLRDRVGAAFVSAGGISAGEEGALASIHRSMLIFGMVIVGGDDWRSALGASAVVDEEPFATGLEVAPAFLAKAERLGRRVADYSRRLRCPG